MSHIAALGSAISVVSHIHANRVQLVLDAVGIGTNLPFELRNLIDIGNAQSRSKLSIRLVNTAAIAVASENHGVVHIGGDEQVRLTSTTEVLASLTQSRNHSLGIDEAFSEILLSVGALKLLCHGGEVHILVDGVQLIIGPDRTNLVWEDFLRITVGTLISQHSSNSQSFLQRNLVDAVLELNIVEIFDIHHIITMKLGSDIYRLRVGGTPYQLVVAGDFLLISFRITLGFQCIDVTDIHMRSTNPAMRNLLSLGHNRINPSHIVGDKFRSTTGMSLNILREHGGNVSVASLNKTADVGVLKPMLLTVNFHSKLERTNVARFSKLQNFTLSRMRQNVILSLTLIVKHIMFHIFVSSFRIVIVIFLRHIFAKSHAD